MHHVIPILQIGERGVVRAQRGKGDVIVHQDVLAVARFAPPSLVAEEVAHLKGRQSVVVERHLIQTAGKAAAEAQGLRVRAGRAADGQTALLVAVDVQPGRRPVIGRHHVVPLVLHQGRLGVDGSR